MRAARIVRRPSRGPSGPAQAAACRPQEHGVVARDGDQWRRFSAESGVTEAASWQFSTHANGRVVERGSVGAPERWLCRLSTPAMR